MELSKKVVVIPVEWGHAVLLARHLAGAGATVVLVGPDADAAGRLASTLEADGNGRPAVFLTDGSAAGVHALADFLAEMFRES